MVLTRDHTFTILNIDGNDIFIENTSEAGFNYINNPHLINREELVSRLQKDKHIVLNQKEMILSIYANRIYYINGPEKAFQISLKALALDPESIAKYNNIQAGFFNYLQYLTKNEKNYEKSYSITQEAVESLKSYPFLLNRYKIDVNNYLILLVENQDFEKALTILQNSSEYISDIDFINEMNFYININYGNFYFSNQNYEKAYSKFMISYEINSRNSTINKNLNSTFIMWAQQNFKNDNYTKAEEIINKGLEIFPESPPLNKMRNYLNKIDY
jgi:tetratricopeptide (TPR) repeat protein